MFTPLRVAAAYLLAAVAMTWPLAAGLTRDVPWDLGDPLLNIYILRWTADQALAFLAGDGQALARYWHPGLFHPEPLALAWSEHLTPQMLQALPVLAVTGNGILAYNLLFLSTFVLSGLGLFLLVREWTGRPAAAFVAGLIFAFAPYRIGQFSHLQVLSAQWMPFVLFGLARYFAAGGWRPLALAATALVLNNLSCGYYLLYFAPFAGLYIAWEVSRRACWRDARMWGQLAAAAAGTAAATLPFLLPYAAVRARGFEPRPMAEVAAFSADVYGYLTAHPLNRVWGSVAQAFPRAEGELFPGAIPVLLVLVALAAAVNQSRIDSCSRTPKCINQSGIDWRRGAAYLALAVCVAHVLLLKVLVFTGGVAVKVAGFPLRASSPGRTLLIAVVTGSVALALMPGWRALASRAWRSPLALAIAGIWLAWTLSLGPRPSAMGRPFADWGPYAWLHAGVPGFDGLRVPARFAMIVALFTAAAAGYGAAAIERLRRGSGLALAAVCVAFLAEATAAPLLVNGTSPLAGVVTPQGRIGGELGAQPIHRRVAALPAGSVLAEFPFGVDDYELRYMLASLTHGKPLLNGYSGGFPTTYMRYRARLGRVLDDPDGAWQALLTSPATHVIVHEGIYLNGEGARVTRDFITRGARELARDGGDVLLAVIRR